MDGDEPEMGECCLDDRIDIRRRFEPSQKARHLTVEPVGGWRFEVNPFAPDRPGHNLHRSGAAIPPCADLDPGYAAAPGRKQGRMPVE